MFPQAFGTEGASQKNGEMLSIKAGKMFTAPRPNGNLIVTAQKERGRIVLRKGTNGTVHFEWHDRKTNKKVDDYIVRPKDATFSKVDTKRTDDRVYLLQFQNSDERHFFWFQDKNSDKDESVVKKLNALIERPVVDNSSDTATSGPIDQNRLMQLLMGQSGSFDEGQSSSGDESTTAEVRDETEATNASSTGNNTENTTRNQESESRTSRGDDAPSDMSSNHDADSRVNNAQVSNEVQMLDLQQILDSVQQMPQTSSASRGPAVTTQTSSSSSVSEAVSQQGGSTTTQATNAGQGITTADLLRAMASVQSSQTSRARPVSLGKIFDPQKLENVIQDPDVQSKLVQLLPSDMQNVDELRKTLRTPQFGQSVRSLTRALHSANYNTILSNFDLNPSAGAGQLAQGDAVGAFLAAILEYAKQQADDGSTSTN